MQDMDGEFPARVRARAEKLFASGRFFCAESVLRAFVDELGMPEKRSLVALMSGFSTGMGGAGCSCGAVVGGVAAVGLLFGRTVPGDQRVFRCKELAKEVHGAFRAAHGHICCRALNRGIADKSPEKMAKCTVRTGDAAFIAAAIVQRERRTRAERGVSDGS